MANLRTTERGRHRWVEGYREVQALQNDRRDALKCGNCGTIWLLTQSDDPPIKGCISEIDLTKLGPSMQKDQLERDLRGGLYHQE